MVSTYYLPPNSLFMDNQWNTTQIKKKNYENPKKKENKNKTEITPTKKI